MIETLQLEFARYEAVLKRSRPTHETSAHEWWKSNRDNFPQLSKLSSEFLAIPASSVECERSFRYFLSNHFKLCVNFGKQIK